MRVFRIQNDLDHYQYFLLENSEDRAKLDFDCTPRKDTWRPPEVYILYPKLKASDFFQFDSSGLITSPRATAALRRHLERAGELLPLPYAGTIYTVLNVLECIDVLDESRCEFYYTPSGTRSGIKKYAFHRKRFTETTLFKIPQTYRSEILVVEGMFSIGDFRDAVRENGLRGLFFTEIWNDLEQSD